MNRKGFTLIELLVVIAIIAILAAILFPVFAQAKAAAKKAADLSNVKELGIATKLYLSDYDDTFYPHRFNCKDAYPSGNFIECAAYTGKAEAAILGPTTGSMANSARSRYYWVYMLQPYAKNYGIFRDPAASGVFSPSDTALGPNCTGAGCIGNGYGGQNSYGHNDAWLSPAGSFSGPEGQPATVVETSIPRIASTIVVVDATYYGALPDITNESGQAVTANLNGQELAYINTQGSQYKYYWKNVGGANWSYSGGETGPLATGNAAAAVTKGKSLHNGTINAQFADGHAKSLPYTKAIGDVCLWTTDAEGGHPNCN